MTRAEAEQRVEDCARNMEALRTLSVHWIGHPQDGMSAEDLENLLYEYVDENSLADRAVGPQPSDPCDLTDPDRAPYTDAQMVVFARVSRLAGLDTAQMQCLYDTARATEALGMLADLQARTGVSGDILAPARAILRDISGPEDPVAIMTDLLRAWQELQGLPNDCAVDQRAMRRDLSPVQRAWLDSFCSLWEKTV